MEMEGEDKHVMPVSLRCKKKNKKKNSPKL